MSSKQKRISINATVMSVIFTFFDFYEPTLPLTRRPFHLSFMLTQWAMIAVVWAVVFFLSDVPKAK